MTMADNNSPDRLLDHSYDGIQEYDNPLPRWWVYLFWATIVFAALYGLNVPGFGVGKGRIAAYVADSTAAAATFAALTPATGPSAELLAAAAKDPAVIAEGKTVWMTNCVACHRPDGGGLVGPNLTDDYWIHGGTLVDIRNTIQHGVLAKGMPEWGKILRPEQVTAAAVYVTTLHGTNPPNPKEPQGVKVTP